ncbi:uncharacterized protein TNCV_4337691 [Trichonephila clavipes]|uniref:Transposase n=1 Tax=Trichonephila clavipes TaxID=2585209 RepID=A0A8X6SSC0_TRICX|nr:uncharacterized protein TNCV_4337691 [Trichonephila clavipes]
MEAIASESASGTNSAREAARDDWAYHHHLSAIFFVDSSSCIHTNCNRAVNFCQQIPHRGKHLRINGWITETVNAQRYLTLLRETVVPCLIQRDQISNVTFMQDGATSHTANPVKAFLIQTFGEDRIVSRRCRYPWPPRSPDFTPADFWLWVYLKSRVYLSGPSSLSELKDAIRREVSSIHPDVLYSTVAGFVTHLECLLPCGGGHVV